MSNRWRILALLFCVRLTMAVQFQAVAALSPLLMTQYGLGLADIGLLLGLYLSPGIIIALPGGAIAQRFGDKQMVAFGMVLMLIGSLITLFVPTWEAQLVGRVIAGVGGVILNVVMSKMITDWFDVHKLATAMGIFVNSWPLGIAATLLVLPLIAGSFGVFAAFALVSVLIVVGLVALVALYQSPDTSSNLPKTGEAAPAVAVKLRGKALYCLIIAGCIWGFYNAGLAMIFGFGPTMLIEREWSVAAASSATSIVLWLAAVSVPLGGLIADRLNRSHLILFVGLFLFATGLAMVPLTDLVVPALIWLGLVSGLAAGPIMALPSLVLQPQNRARGMGLFFTIYYLAIFVGPTAGGYAAEWFASADAAIYLGSFVLVACIFLHGLFLVLQRQMVGAETPSSA